MRSDDLRQYVTPDENRGCEHLFRYRGVRCSQSPHVLEALDRLHAATSDQTADIIIEIGTMYGGFTQVLRDHDIGTSARIYTCDIKDTVVKPLFEVTRLMGDALQSRLVQDMIRSENRVFVFCDGGDKPKEFNFFSELLKPWDLILAHDYVPSPERRPAYWPGYEVIYDDIKFAIEKNGLVPFAANEMNAAMWGCWMKASA